MENGCLFVAVWMKRYNCLNGEGDGIYRTITTYHVNTIDGFISYFRIINTMELALYRVVKTA